MGMRKPGGQPKNGNAIRHGAYRSLTKMDGRTKEAQALQQVEAELVSAVGGDPSPQEILIIKRASVKALRCALMEVVLMRDRNPSHELEQNYIRWSRDLREDLKAIGLRRRERKIAADLNEYIETQYG